MQFRLADVCIPTEVSRNPAHLLRKDISKPPRLSDGKPSMLIKHLIQNSKFNLCCSLFFFLQWTLDPYLNG